MAKAYPRSEGTHNVSLKQDWYTAYSNIHNMIRIMVRRQLNYLNLPRVKTLSKKDMSLAFWK